jgi:hypothetical protein
MKTKVRLFAVIVVLALTLTVAGIVLAANQSIDTFNTGLISLLVFQSDPSDPGDVAWDYSSAVSAAALGGDREATIQWVGGTGASASIQTDVVNSNRLAYAAGGGITAIGTVRWDGTGGTADVNDCNLNNIDLRATGSTPENNGFHLEVVDDDWPVDMVIRIYSGATCTSMAEAVVHLPGGIAIPDHVDFFVPYNTFTTVSGTPDFTAVRAIELVIDGTVTAATDVSVDFLDADWYREYGDLPNTYGAGIVNAFQVPQGLRLGRNVDVESVSQPDVSAGTATTGDDRTNLAGEVDDEDGVLRPNITKWTPGGTAGLTVTVNGCAGTCYLNGWVDFLDNADFADTGEHVYNDVPVSDGTALRSFSVPAPVPGFPGTLYARFRICNATGTCNAPDSTNVTNGEIEDYVWNFGPTAVTLDSLQAQPVNPSPVLPLALVGGAAAILIGAVLFTRKSRKHTA